MKRQQPYLIEQWFDEDALARAIGICVDRVQSVRREKMQRGEGWKLEHGHIAYSRDGAVMLIALLGVVFPSQKKDAAADTWGRPTLEDVLARAEIGGTNAEHVGCERFAVAGPMPDHQKLLAYRMSDGFGCTVLVPNNTNFLIGMEFVARLVNERAAVYELVGAAPRWRGRW